MKNFKQYNEDFNLPNRFTRHEDVFPKGHPALGFDNDNSSDEHEIHDIISQDIVTALDDIYQTYHKHFTIRQEFDDLVKNIL